MKFAIVFAAVLALAAGAPWSWNLNELSMAIQNPDTNPEYLPYLENALNQMMEAIYAGKPVEPIAIVMPTVQPWSLHELSAALDNPSTDPALIPYLEDALNQMMHALYNGQQMESIPVVVPVGLMPVQVESPVEVAPGIVLPTPEIPSPVPVETVVPESPAAPSPSSPLVQIIVNINQQQQITDITAPEFIPSPVTVVEEAENISVNPVDVIAISPPEVNPVDVVAVNPPQINPIDVVAVSPPLINPIDAMAPLPIEA